jgi:hypothetical protein
MIIFGMFIALSFFFYMNQQRSKRLEERHERSRERFEQLRETIREKESPPAESTPGKGPME